MIFLSVADVLKIHRRTIAEQGGSEGIRDENLLQSALAAAQNRFFMKTPTLPRVPRLTHFIFPKLTPLLTVTNELPP